jgi:hypothetical protein
MANRSDRDRQRPKNDASIIARPFVRQPIRENHQGLRSMNRAARPDTRQQALVSPHTIQIPCKGGGRSIHIVLFEQHSADQPGDTGLVGEDTDDVGAPFDLFIQPLQWIG